MKSEMNPLLRKRSPRRSPCGVRRATPLFFADNHDRELRFNDILPDGPGRLVSAGLVGEVDRQQWRSRFFPLTLLPKPATSLGKIEMGTVYHGVHAFLRWRSRQNPRRAGENSIRNPFIMAIPQEKAAITPKPATHGRFGENRMGTRLSWRLSQEKAAVTPKPATFERFGEIPRGSRLFWRSPRNARSDWRNKKG